MATYEQYPLMTYKDKNNDKHLIFPITKADCVDGLDEILALMETKADAVQGNLNTHATNKQNPHEVTRAQLGAEASGSAATVQTNLNIHAKDFKSHSGTATTSGSVLSAAGLLVNVPTLTLVDGVAIRIKLHTAIQAGATLGVNGSGAKAIVDAKGKPVKAGAVKDSYLTVVYNGTNFILQGEGGGSSGETYGNELGQISSFELAMTGFNPNYRKVL